MAQLNLTVTNVQKDALVEEGKESGLTGTDNEVAESFVMGFVTGVETRAIQTREDRRQQRRSRIVQGIGQLTPERRAQVEQMLLAELAADGIIVTGANP